MNRIKPSIYKLLCEQCRRTVAYLCDGGLVVVSRHQGHYHVSVFSAATLRGILDADSRRSVADSVLLACAHCGVHLPQAEARMDVAGRPYCSDAHRLLGPG
jgi:hypothetical protein